MKKIFVLLALSAGILACNNSATAEGEATEVQTENKVEALKAEVMVLHDKTMPKLSQMGQLSAKLKAAVAEAPDSSAYFNAINDLTQAKESMMDWMHNFQNPDDMDATEEEKLAYLNSEKEKMADIADYTDRSIEKAKEILSK